MECKTSVRNESYTIGNRENNVPDSCIWKVTKDSAVAKIDRVNSEERSRWSTLCTRVLSIQPKLASSLVLTSL